LFIAAALCALAVSCGEKPSSESKNDGTTLCVNDFQNCVAPVLSAQIRRNGGAIVSCMDAACHLQGGSGGRFTLSATDMDANFQAVLAQVNLASPNAQESLLLIEPVQDSVLPSAVAGAHGGGELFPVASSDPAVNQCTAALSRWISTRVDSQTSPLCGSCPPPNTTNCGY
jgi:hypothetical protein